MMIQTPILNTAKTPTRNGASGNGASGNGASGSVVSHGTRVSHGKKGSHGNGGSPVSRILTGTKTYLDNRFQAENSSQNGNGFQNGKRYQNGKTSSSASNKNRKSTKAWSPWKLILLSVVLGLAGSIYLTHVFETQNTLREVQQLRREFERAQRIHTEAKRDYDRITGPSEVYSRAQTMGMVSGGAADPVIHINP